MLDWYERNRARVDAWLARNPPPPNFAATAPPDLRRLEWAFLEMPDPERLLGRVLLALGL